MLDWAKITHYNNCYTFDLRSNDKVVASALEASHNTIKYIKENYPSPYTLYLSGGIDSQAMLYAWITSGEKFNTFSCLYNDTMNIDDIRPLKIFADIHNVKIDYYNLDLIAFLENEHDYYAYTYKCGSPHITTYMKMLSLTNEGTCIMSGNFISEKHTGLDPNQIGLYHYGMISKQNVIPFFFLETKELAYSFTVAKYNKKPSNRKRCLDPISELTRSYDLKTNTYHLNNFPVIPQKNKTTGFDKIKDYYDKCDIPISPIDRLCRLTTQYSNRKFDLFFRNKYELIMSKYKYTILTSDKNIKYAQ